MRTLLFLAAVMPLLMGCDSGATDEIERALVELTRIRDQKQTELKDYFEHVNETVTSAREDEQLVSAFTELRSLYLGVARPSGSDGYRPIAAIERDIVERYLDEYQVFYDVHFIESDGEVFYTLLKQPNLFQNIFAGDLAGSALARQLRANPESSAVDFTFMNFTSEPSAFFAEPVRTDGEHLGWIVFQFASLRLNEIFPYEPLLGVTGEVFLVNRDQFMLTDSYNSPESAILRRHLSAENIEAKFAEGEGRKTVVDYRGHVALTSFEVVDIAGFEWLLIAKIDRDEVVTRQYMSAPDTYREQVLAVLRDSGRAYSDAEPPARDHTVNLDEYLRVDTEEVLYTPGVSTCTAVIVSLPGEFAYMAHVSPYDRIYGGSRTDLVGSISKRITDFEIADKRMRDLEVVVVTPHIQYSEQLIDELVEDGLFLSQITIMKNPDARCADVTYEFSTNTTYVTWCTGDDRASEPVQLSREAQSVGEIMEGFLVDEG